MALQGLAIKLSLTTALCAGLVFAAAIPQAQAGFTWTPEPAAQAAPAPETPRRRMAAPPADDILTPAMPMESVAAPAAPAPEKEVIQFQGKPPTAPAAAAPAMSKDLAMPPSMQEEKAAASAAPADIMTKDGQVERYRSMYGTIELENDRPAMAPAPAAKTAKAQHVPPVQKIAAQAAPMPVQSQNNTVQPADMVEGFGSDIPLAYALRQVVPPQYAFAFGNQINPGVRVSWNGGKSWPDVVRDMVAPLNMQTRVQGNIVHILPGGQAAPRAMNAPQAIESIPQSVMVERKNIVDPGYGTDKSAAMMTPIPAAQEAATAAAPAEMKEPMPLLPPEAAPPAPPSDQALSSAAAATTTPKDNKSFESEFLKVMRNSDSLNTPPTRQAENSVRPGQYTRYTERLEKEISSIESASGYSDLKSGTSGPSGSVWEAARGQSLKMVLTEWAKQAGVTLVWEAAHDYQIGADVMVSDSFQSALRALFSDGLNTGEKPSFRLLGKSATQPAALLIQDTSTTG